MHSSLRLSTCLSLSAGILLLSFTRAVPKESQRTVIPLIIDYDKKHRDITPVMQVTVNNVTVNVVFDTGSFGLRLLKGAVKDAAFGESSKRCKYGYGSGKDSLKIAGAVEKVAQIFKITKIDNVIELYKTVKESVESYS